MTDAAAPLLVVGRLAGAHGVRGWVKVYSYTEPREAIFDYRPWYVGADARPMTLAAGQPHGKVLVARLEEVADREAAAALRGADVAVTKAQLPALPPGEFYWADLIGLSVRTVEGVALGRVVRLLETGANDVLVVADDARERLVPYLPDSVVREIDLAAGAMVVDWDPEL